ncbi:membrane protein [Mycobacterium phage Hilltopfarm]|nr:membrane protein [Mycobacterium phage Hilltopfarm]
MSKKTFAVLVTAATAMILLAGIAIAISVTRGPARSDEDQAFLTALTTEGIDISDDKRADQLIAKGHNVCTTYDQGGNLVQLSLAAMGDPSLTMKQHGAVIFAGVSTYCPNHLYTLAEQAEQLSKLGGTNA